MSPKLVGRDDDGVVHHLQGHSPGGNGRLAAGFQCAQGLDHALARLRGDRARARQCGILGVQVIILAASATVVSGPAP